MKTIHLKDFQEVVLNESLRRNTIRHEYDKHLILDAINAHVNDGLRYHNGNTINNSFGKVGEYVESMPKYKSAEETAKFEFVPWVRNSCSRVQRGYSLIEN